METIMNLWRKIFIIILFLLVLIYPMEAQEYKISFFGIPTANVTMIRELNEIHFTFYSVGIIDLIWPAKNQYITTFDSLSFGLRNFEKKIKQGDTMYKLVGTYNPADSTLHYEKITLQRVPEIQTIFTLLARIQKDGAREIDTKWFPMDHDSQLYKARFLWADTRSVSALGRNIICDHYRLDIRPLEDVKLLPEQEDYFMNNIIETNALRQLWVEKSGEFRIIQAEVNVFGINVMAKITHE